MQWQCWQNLMPDTPPLGQPDIIRQHVVDLFGLHLDVNLWGLRAISTSLVITEESSSLVVTVVSSSLVFNAASAWLAFSIVSTGVVFIVASSSWIFWIIAPGWASFDSSSVGTLSSAVERLGPIASDCHWEAGWAIFEPVPSGTYVEIVPYPGAISCHIITVDCQHESQGQYRWEQVKLEADTRTPQWKQVDGRIVGKAFNESILNHQSLSIILLLCQVISLNGDTTGNDFFELFTYASGLPHFGKACAPCLAAPIARWKRVLQRRRALASTFIWFKLDHFGWNHSESSLSINHCEWTVFEWITVSESSLSVNHCEWTHCEWITVSELTLNEPL